MKVIFGEKGYITMATIEELKKALLTIKTECGKHDYNCVGCPLATNEYNICGVVGDVSSSEKYKTKPQYWKIIQNIKIFET